MDMWHKIKQFFGFEKPVAPPKALRPREALEAALANVGPGDALTRLQVAAEQAEQGWGALVNDPATAPERLDEQLELLYYCYTQLHPAAPDHVDLAYEQLLERVHGVLLRYIRDGQEVLAQLDQYIQRYEEAIYLTEAKGEYVLARSEHGVYIRLPFMAGAILKSAQRPAAAKILSSLFHRSYALSFLELQSAVPWSPISFVDFMALAKERKMALVTDGIGYYACLDHA